MSAATHTPGPWVCPWAICSHDQAQECRANVETKGKRLRGCGTYFPADTTPDEARAQVHLPIATATGSDHDH